jgi:hypothetical protein
MHLVSFPTYVKTAHFLLFSKLSGGMSYYYVLDLKVGFLFSFFLRAVLLER